MNVWKKAKLYHRWWKAWRALPVVPWVNAAQLYRERRFDEAVGFYREGLLSHASHPAAASARLDLSYCLFKVGEVEEAEAELSEILTQLPSLREGYIRLASIQLWLGQALEAAWTLRRALRHMSADAELVGFLVIAVLENGGPLYLLNEARRDAERFIAQGEAHPRLKLASALLKIHDGKGEEGLEELEHLAGDAHATRESILALCDQLIEEGKTALARQHLRRLMVGSADHPRVLSLMASSYLVSGPFYNAEYAVQLASAACQRTGWASPREMHTLAEAYYHQGDKVGALLVASRAKDAGLKLLGSYRSEKNLDQLIESLSSGTQA